MKQQDAIALLKADHKKVKGLFAETDDLSDRATTQLKRIGDQVCQELTVHAEIEETLFYPAVKDRTQRGHKEERDLVLESYEEHSLVKKIISDLEAIDASDESYRPKLKVLREMVEQHVKEEERELFPGARELLNEDELMELGMRMTELKNKRLPAAV
ncbi:MAG: hemerythrin [Candidatus Eremiobacteraeota bacterium]|jgi:hemerythrin superfamily protein|nr:hemerythrin [Candidatus Eremiobacteraeota bacterium]